MIYGYNILEKNIVGHGMPWWDEYYETTELKVIDTKLFGSKEKCQKNIDIQTRKFQLKIDFEEIFIVPFEVKGELKK